MAFEQNTFLSTVNLTRFRIHRGLRTRDSEFANVRGVERARRGEGWDSGIHKVEKWILVVFSPSLRQCHFG